MFRYCTRSPAWVSPPSHYRREKLLGLSATGDTDRIPATIPSLTASHALRAFTGRTDHGGGALLRGNPCLVHLAATAPATAPATASVTQCVSWQDSGCAHVRCWTATGAEIQLCGHGLLCCASVWQSVGREQVALTMNGVEVRFETRDGLGWLAFPRIPVEDCAIPDWANGLLGAAPAQAAVAGPGNGYLVLELPEDCDLAALGAPGQALVNLSERSVIVTSRVSAAAALYGETIQFRYFAPQHGVPEDTATGSAMRVLATYWQGRGKGNIQKALQRSPGGGWLQSRIEGQYTWVGGRVIADVTEGAA